MGHGGRVEGVEWGWGGGVTQWCVVVDTLASYTSGPGFELSAQTDLGNRCYLIPCIASDDKVP